MAYTTTQLQTEFNDLPETVQNYILSDNVTETVATLADWFEINNKQIFGEEVFGLLVGTMDANEFIQTAKEKFGFTEEDADNLFGEVGSRVLSGAHQLMQEALGEAPTLDSASKNPAYPIGSEARRFVGIPAYGVEKPASSYTSVLPRAEMGTANKPKEVPGAESFIQKLNNLGVRGAMPAPTAPPVAMPKAPTSGGAPTAKTVPPPANLPVLEKDIAPIELAKLARAVNIPRQEIKMEPKIELKPEAPKNPVQNPPPVIPKPPVPPSGQPAAPVPPKPRPTYSMGTDPYREPPTP